MSNKESILENFHFYSLIKILEQTKLLENLSAEEQQLVRGNIQSIISDTDMRRHAQVRSNLNSEEFKKNRATKTESIEN
tara:strand:+ start:747 stop:983 length:237 start_codon:yes stop_codon:yes gene_type:complete